MEGRNNLEHDNEQNESRTRSNNSIDDIRAIGLTERQSSQGMCISYAIDFVDLRNAQ